MVMFDGCFALACARGRPRLPASLPVSPACGRGAEKVEPGASCHVLQEKVRLGAQAQIQASILRLLGSRARKAGLGLPPPCHAGDLWQAAWPGGGFSPEDWDFPNLKEFQCQDEFALGFYVPVHSSKICHFKERL